MCSIIYRKTGVLFRHQTLNTLYEPPTLIKDSTSNYKSFYFMASDKLLNEGLLKLVYRGLTNRVEEDAAPRTAPHTIRGFAV